jgi:hypothetical protein
MDPRLREDDGKCEDYGNFVDVCKRANGGKRVERAQIDLKTVVFTKNGEFSQHPLQYPQIALSIKGLRATRRLSPSCQPSLAPASLAKAFCRRQFQKYNPASQPQSPSP